METCLAEVSLDRRGRLMDPRGVSGRDASKREAAASAGDTKASPAGLGHEGGTRTEP
jgi:hypothetical protein